MTWTERELKEIQKTSWTFPEHFIYDQFTFYVKEVAGLHLKSNSECVTKGLSQVKLGVRVTYRFSYAVRHNGTLGWEGELLLIKVSKGTKFQIS